MQANSGRGEVGVVMAPKEEPCRLAVVQGEANDGWQVGFRTRQPTTQI